MISMNCHLDIGARGKSRLMETFDKVQNFDVVFSVFRIIVVQSDLKTLGVTNN